MIDCIVAACDKHDRVMTDCIVAVTQTKSCQADCIVAVTNKTES